MRRNKRSLHQLQQTVRMKIAVVQQQKEDLVDILNDFTSSVLTEAEQMLTEVGGSQAQYQETLMQLDRVSQLFTNLSSHIDSTLYPDDEEKQDKSKIEAAGDCRESIHPSTNNMHSAPQSLKDQAMGNHFTNSNKKIIQRLPEENNESNKALQKRAHKLTQPTSHEKTLNPEEGTHNHAVVREPRRPDLNKNLHRGEASEMLARESEIEEDEAKNLVEESRQLVNTTPAAEKIVSEKKAGKKKGKKKSFQVMDMPNTSSSHYTSPGDSPSLASLEVRPSSDSGARYSSMATTVEYENVIQPAGSSEEPHFSPHPEVNESYMSQSTPVKESPPKAIPENASPPVLSAAVPHIPTPSPQPPVFHDSFVQTSAAGFPIAPSALSSQMLWSQYPVQHLQSFNPMVPGQNNDAYTMMNMTNPRHALLSRSYPSHAYPENPGLLVGQNFFRQPALMLDNYRTTYPCNFPETHSNVTHFGQPVWSPAFSNHLPQLPGLGVGQLLPPMQGLLVQPPVLPRPQTPGGFEIRAVESERSDTRSNGMISPNPSSLGIAVSPTQSMLDQEVSGLTKERKSKAKSRSAVTKLPRQLSSDTSNDIATTDTAAALYPFQVQGDLSALPSEADCASIASSLHSPGRPTRDDINLTEGSPSPTFSVSSGSQTSSVNGARLVSHAKKSKKLQPIPADLRDVIKQALQEKERMETKEKRSTEEKAKIQNSYGNLTDDSTPQVKRKRSLKGAVEPTISQLHLKKDEINSVAISNVDDPWAFHAQMTALLPEIVIGIQEAIDNGSVKKVAAETGLFCLARFTDNKYYRAKIEHHYGMGDFPARIQVSYIDYGNKHWVSASDLYELPESLARYPAQAVFCALAKVSPATGDWTEQATRLLRQLTQDVHVHLRVVRPPSKRRHPSSTQGSGTSCPKGDPEPPSPTSPEASSPCRLPHLVDIISRQGKGGQATSVSSALVKAGHAQPVDVDSQVEALARFSARPADHRLQGLQQLMLSMKAGHKGKSPTSPRVSHTTQVASEPSHGVKSLSRSIPACLRLRNIRGLNSSSKSSAINLKADGALSEYGSQGSGDKVCGRSDRFKPEAGQETENSPENDQALSLQVDRKLRALGQAVQKAKKQMESRNLDALEASSVASNSECSSDEEVADSDLKEPEMEYEVTVVSTISPSSFFVHRVNDHATLSYLTEKLNKAFLSLPDQALASMSAALTLQRHQLCCAVFSQDGCFYRGLVLEASSAVVLILFIDFGDFEWVSRAKVYPLSQELKVFPPVALWCCLEGVDPLDAHPSSNSAPNASWSSHAVGVFKSLVTRNKLMRIVTSQRIERKHSFQCEPLPVFLLDCSENVDGSSEEESTEEICLNYELIHLGLASLKGPPVLHTDWEDGIQQASEPNLTDWDPLQEEFESHRNSYGVNTDDPGVALIGYEAGKVGPRGQKVCVFYNRRLGCFKGDNCRDLHVRVPTDGLSHDLTSVHVFDEDQSSLLPSEGTLVMVTVATAITPYQFYVTLPWGRLTVQQVARDSDGKRRLLNEESLEGLMDNLQIYYAQHHYDGDLTVSALGEAMAAKVKDQWVRAKVIGSDEDKDLVHVISVDFGWTAWVKERALRKLELRFLHLPPQAVSCGLAGVEPLSGHSHGWPQKACEYFSDLVLGKSLLARVTNRDPSGHLSVVLHDTTSGPHDLDINQMLVDAGWAKVVQPGHSSHTQDRIYTDGKDTLNIAPA